MFLSKEFGHGQDKRDDEKEKNFETIHILRPESVELAAARLAI